jgi:4-amino-4-deoxy-L-arabinose transferase-like glycosyltransferase
VDPRLATAISGYGWVYFVASIYYVFGRNQLLVQLVNCIVGGLTVLVIYAISKDLFDRQVARWAALFMAFFPQMVFWSAGMYKDSAVLLCLAVSMYAVLGLRRRLTPGLVLLLLTALLVLMALRFYIAYFVLFAAVGTFLFSQRRGLLGTVFVYALLVLAIGGALRFVIREESMAQQASYMTLERLQVTREDQARWGRSGFGEEYDVSTPSGALRALPVGFVHLLFAPFPWAVTSVRQILTLPETLVWYALMPAFVRGVRHAIRHQFRDVLPVLVFTASLTAAYALMQGNVGTAYRQRTQVTMFFFVFMGVGLVEKERRKAAGRARIP